MKIQWFIILLLGVTIILNAKAHYSSRDTELVNATLTKGAKIIQNKYGLESIGSGASMPGGPIRKLNLSFQVKGPLPKDALRKLLILSARELVTLVTDNQEMQQYLYEPPFTIKNVQLIIFNHDKRNYESCYPNVSVAQISKGEFTYRYTDPDNTFVYKLSEAETYEEALQLSGLEP